MSGGKEERTLAPPPLEVAGLLGVLVLHPPQELVVLVGPGREHGGMEGWRHLLERIVFVLHGLRLGIEEGLDRHGKRRDCLLDNDCLQRGRARDKGGLLGRALMALQSHEMRHRGRLGRLLCSLPSKLHLKHVLVG